MTFDYISPASSAKDAVRFLVGDTSEDEPFLQDEEIEFLITTWNDNVNSPYLFAAKAAAAISAKLAREVTFSSDAQQLSLDQLQQKYTELSYRLMNQHNDLLAGAGVDVGGLDPREQASRANIKPLSFGRGMMDNWEAGQQDMGDYRGAYDPFTGQWGEFTG